MKTLKLLTISLLLALCTGFYSCEEFHNSLPENRTETTDTTTTKEIFSEYLQNSANIKCKTYQDKKDSILLSGIKDNHLWFAYYNKTSKQLVSEWTDIEKTDTIQYANRGYGEYYKVFIQRALGIYKRNTSTGNIVVFRFNEAFYQTIFTSNSNSKRTPLLVENSYPTSWYKESVFIDNCCYSHEGDTLYIANESPFKYNHIPIPISYEEGINWELAKTFRVSKYDYKLGKTIWSASTQSPFNEPDNCKYSCTLVDNSTDIWEFKIDIAYYDGTKKDYTVKVDVEGGKIIANVTGITLNESRKELQPNQTFQLIATIQPNNVTNKNVTWSSSNKSIASVNQNGLVTAKSAGEAIITVTTEDGNFTASSTITVKDIQNIDAYIDADIRANGSNSMGQFYGVIDSKISNSSNESVTLISMKIINGDNTTIFSKNYDDRILKAKDSYEESVQGLPAIHQPTVKWIYEYKNKQYTISKTLNK